MNAEEVIKHVVFWGCELSGYEPKVFMSTDIILMLQDHINLSEETSEPNSFMGFPLIEIKGRQGLCIVGK